MAAYQLGYTDMVIAAGFIVIMVGFLMQRPTLVTLAMFPVLVAMYTRLARREVREVFGEEYERYAATTPAFLPRPRRQRAKGIPYERFYEKGILVKGRRGGGDRPQRTSTTAPLRLLLSAFALGQLSLRPDA